MYPLTHLLESSGLQVDRFLADESSITFVVRTTSRSACCPLCSRPSDRVHGRYGRTIKDLPCHGRPVTLRLSARKFLCRNSDCPRAVFCERLPKLVPAFARTTDALTRAHYDLGLALGGEAGARLADRLAMPTSPDTLLRRVKQFPRQPPLPPRVVGIDDWAWRKGQSYGTILIDQERRKVLDLLPDRTSETLQTWLKGHPQIEVITRDRSSTYAQAASSAAPQARQIADRWHLLKNLREAVERIFGRLSPLVRTALTEPAPTTAATDGSDQTPALEPSTTDTERHSGSGDPNSPSAEATPLLQYQAREEKRRQRVLRHQRVRSLRSQGFSMRQIARETGLSLQVVRRYCRTD